MPDLTALSEKNRRYVDEVERLLRQGELYGDVKARPKDVAWMRICYFSARELSTCAKRQYFALILAADGSGAGFGYNGGPSGVTHCKDGGCPRFQEGSAAGTNYDNCIAIHAEENALIRSAPDRRSGGTIYINGTPCFGCAKKICNSGLKRVVVVDDPSYADGKRGYDFMRKTGLDVVVLKPDLFDEFKET